MLVMLALLACFRGAIVVDEGRGPCAGVATWTVVGGLPSDVPSLEGLVLEEPGELELCVEGAHARVEVRAPGVVVRSGRGSEVRARLLGTPDGEVVWVAPGASLTMIGVEAWSVVGGVGCEAGASVTMTGVVLREDVEEGMRAPLLAGDGCDVELHSASLLSEQVPLLRLTGGANLIAEETYLYGGGEDDCAWVDEATAQLNDAEWVYCGLSVVGSSSEVALRDADLFRSSWWLHGGDVELVRTFVTEAELDVAPEAHLSWRQVRWYDSVVRHDGEEVQAGGSGETP